MTWLHPPIMPVSPWPNPSCGLSILNITDVFALGLYLLLSYSAAEFNLLFFSHSVPGFWSFMPSTGTILVNVSLPFFFLHCLYSFALIILSTEMPFPLLLLNLSDTTLFHYLDSPSVILPVSS